MTGRAIDSRAPLSREEVETLGRYNAEVARGIMHKVEWKVKMVELQARFNRRNR